jgi:hypothetical protein
LGSIIAGLAMEANTSNTCPSCKKPMAFALPPGGGRRTLQCLDCDRPDPLKSGLSKGWLQGELGRQDSGEERININNVGKRADGTNKSDLN